MHRHASVFTRVFSTFWLLHFLSSLSLFVFFRAPHLSRKLLSMPTSCLSAPSPASSGGGTPSRRGEGEKNVSETFGPAQKIYAPPPVGGPDRDGDLKRLSNDVSGRFCVGLTYLTSWRARICSGGRAAPCRRRHGGHAGDRRHRPEPLVFLRKAERGGGASVSRGGRRLPRPRGLGAGGGFRGRGGPRHPASDSGTGCTGCPLLVLLPLPSMRQNWRTLVAPRLLSWGENNVRRCCVALEGQTPTQPPIPQKRRFGPVLPQPYGDSSPG